MILPSGSGNAVFKEKGLSEIVGTKSLTVQNKEVISMQVASTEYHIAAC